VVHDVAGVLQALTVDPGSKCGNFACSIAYALTKRFIISQVYSMRVATNVTDPRPRDL